MSAISCSDDTIYNTLWTRLQYHVQPDDTIYNTLWTRLQYHVQMIQYITHSGHVCNIMFR